MRISCAIVSYYTAYIEIDELMRRVRIIIIITTIIIITYHHHHYYHLHYYHHLVSRLDKTVVPSLCPIIDLQLNSRLPVFLRLHCFHLYIYLSIYLVTVVMRISCTIVRATYDR